MSSRRSGIGRVLVTGGAGLIGSHLVERLVQDGVQVLVLDDLSSPAKLRVALPVGCEFWEGSVLDARLVDEAVSSCDAVFHLAAVVGVRRVLEDPLRALAVNTDGTSRVLEACARHGRRVVYTSSSEVYGRGTKTPFSEDDSIHLGPPHVSRWSYALSKLHGEVLGLELARRRGLSFVAARMFNVVGPGQRADQGMVLPSFVEAAQAGGVLRVYAPGTQRRCFTHARDAARVLWRLMLEGPAEPLIVNIGSGRSIAVRALAELVCRQVGQGRIEQIDPLTVMPPGFEEVPDRVPDLARLESILGPQVFESLETIVAELARGSQSEGGANVAPAARQ